jgi:diguanylate cyclase (GGDEF)-like protein/excisionase family DNA binding protein
MENFAQVGGDVRTAAGALLRSRQESLAGDISLLITTISPSLDANEWQGCAEVLVRLFLASIDGGAIDPLSAAMRDLERYAPPLTTRQLVDAVHHAERTVLDEVALDDRLGATSEPWAIVAHVIRRATLEILAAHAEHVAGREAPIVVRDTLTTLIAAPVFELALGQEIQRSLRHHHAVALLLIDIDDLSQINREHGRGVGDRVLERLGILARRFFRLHDWVARYGDDSIAVLLPETTVDQASTLAARFRETVQNRLILLDHKTDAMKAVTVSAAAVGTDLVQSEIDAGYVLNEAEAAVLRAKFNGRNRIERVALLPTSLTIFGAATMLGETPRQISRLIHRGVLKATRRGRHFHIDRDLIDEYRRNNRNRG